MRQTKSQETQREEEEEVEDKEEEKEEGSVSLHRETVPSLDTGESCLLKGARLQPKRAPFLLNSFQDQFFGVGFFYFFYFGGGVGGQRNHIGQL